MLSVSLMTDRPSAITISFSFFGVCDKHTFTMTKRKNVDKIFIGISFTENDGQFLSSDQMYIKKYGSLTWVHFKLSRLSCGFKRVYSPVFILVQVTMSTTNHKAHDAFCRFT
jgi:hypothetical protein